MTSKEEKEEGQEREEEYQLPTTAYTEDVTPETRAFADQWLERWKRDCHTLGVSYTVPYRRENQWGQVVYSWWQAQEHLMLVVFILGTEALYMRRWETDAHGKNGKRADGCCTDLDTCRLLWHWYMTYRERVRRESV